MYTTLPNIFLVYFILFKYPCVSEKFHYISTEYPKVTSFNPKYLSYANLTSQRYGRNDPFYYVGLHLNLLRPWSNNVTFQYISTEHPKITYFNPKYVSFFNLTSQRHGRNDPFYYVGLHMDVLQPWANNVSVDFYFYELLTNVYKRGFVEMHFKLCDLIQKDKFFGSALRQGKFLLPCPFPPGEYSLFNMTLPLKHIPLQFPFRRGRIYCNITATDANELIANGHIDMEIKEFSSKRRKKNNLKQSMNP